MSGVDLAIIKSFRIRCVKAPLVLLDVATDAGVVGSSYVFVWPNQCLDIPGSGLNWNEKAIAQYAV